MDVLENGYVQEVEQEKEKRSNDRFIKFGSVTTYPNVQDTDKKRSQANFNSIKAGIHGPLQGFYNSNIRKRVAVELKMTMIPATVVFLPLANQSMRLLVKIDGQLKVVGEFFADKNKVPLKRFLREITGHVYNFLLKQEVTKRRMILPGRPA